jgi:integrase
MKPIDQGTVNHYAKFLKAVFNRAIRHGRIERNPLMPIRLERENNARNRCLSADEEAVLMDALPEWLRPMVTVALNTGMRLGELRALRWEDVDEKMSSIRVRRDKAGDGRWVVMNSAVQEALFVIKRERKVLGAWVFCSPEGKYLHNFERYWRPAVRAAAIPDFRFHDLRHTFASRLAMTPGVDLYTIQKAGGWKTPIMVQRYAHLNPDHIRAAVEQLAARSQGGTGTRTGTKRA